MNANWDRAMGTLAGLAVGDALGTTLEFSAFAHPPDHPRAHREMTGGGPFNVLPGQVTDDTELALALARSIVAAGGYRRHAAALAYKAWAASKPFDIGFTTSTAVSPPIADPACAADEMSARAAVQSQANGALMRVAPLAIWGHKLPPTALSVHARADAAITHPHPHCRLANDVYVFAVARAIADGLGPRALYQAAIDYAASLRAETSDAAFVIDTLQDAAKGPPPSYTQQSGWVRIALHNAFHHLYAERGFEDALLWTVNAGGDTDTNGAIVGALLGAVHGLKAIPPRWWQTVLHCDSPRPAPYRCRDLPELVRALLTLAETAAP